MQRINTLYISSIILSIVIVGCKADDFQKLDKRNWQLTWSDDFDGNAGTPPDPSKWTFDVGTGQNGWGNGEFQFYSDRAENVSLDGRGNLVITARNQPFSGANFSSARVKTQGLFSQQYGRFEARIKTPYGPGIWPAFWMLGDNIGEVGWPQCGEIDILEIRGQEPNILNSALHGPGYSGGSPVSRSYGLIDGRFDNDFYLYAVEWDEDHIDFLVNDYLYARITRDDVPGEWVYDQPFFILMNVAVGGSFVGFPTEQTPFPQSMTIDYVKVYREIE